MAVDSHCHLTLRFSREEIGALLGKAYNAGVNGLILAGYCPIHNEKVAEILDSFASSSQMYPALAGTAGIHPHEADNFTLDHVSQLEK